MPTRRKRAPDNWLVIEGLLVDRELKGVQRAGAWLLAVVYGLFGLGMIVTGYMGGTRAVEFAPIARVIGAVICALLGLLFVAVAIRLTRTLLSRSTR